MPKKDRKQHHRRRQRKHGAGHARLDIAADHELNHVQADEDADHRPPRGELRHFDQGRKQRGDERANEGNVVERERDHAPFQRELQSGDPGERPDEDAGRQAHLRPHLQVFAHLLRGLRARRQNETGGFGSGLAFHPPADVFDLHQSQDDVDKSDQPEAQGGVETPRDLLRRAQQPRDIEMLRPDARQRNPMALEPCGSGGVERLIALVVGEKGAADPAEAPHDQRSKNGADRDRDRHGDREREQRRHPRLQPGLERPDDRNDEQAERQRREHLPRQIGGGGNQDRGDDPDRDIERRVASHAGVPGKRRVPQTARDAGVCARTARPCTGEAILG